MKLDFNETCILNQTLVTDTKDEYIKLLLESKANTKEPEIVESIDSLIDKISVLGEAEFERIKKDRIEKKILTYPPYTI